MALGEKGVADDTRVFASHQDFDPQAPAVLHLPPPAGLACALAVRRIVGVVATLAAVRQIVVAAILWPVVQVGDRQHHTRTRHGMRLVVGGPALGEYLEPPTFAPVAAALADLLHKRPPLLRLRRPAGVSRPILW